MTAALLALAALLLGVALTLAAEYAYRHRAAVAAAYRRLAALRGCKHARTLSRPHLTLTAHGAHRAPKHRAGRHENALEVKAA